MKRASTFRKSAEKTLAKLLEKLHVLSGAVLVFSSVYRAAPPKKSETNG
jgi:hypothetical protein